MQVRDIWGQLHFLVSQNLKGCLENLINRSFGGKNALKHVMKAADRREDVIEHLHRLSPPEVDDRPDSSVLR
jgi:hypothetical protein